MTLPVRKFFSIAFLAVYAVTFPVLEITHMHFRPVGELQAVAASESGDSATSDGRKPSHCPVCLRISSTFPSDSPKHQGTRFATVCQVPLTQTSLELSCVTIHTDPRAPPQLPCA